MEEISDGQIVNFKTMTVSGGFESSETHEIKRAQREKTTIAINALAGNYSKILDVNALIIIVFFSLDRKSIV